MKSIFPQWKRTNLAGCLRSVGLYFQLCSPSRRKQWGQILLRDRTRATAAPRTRVQSISDGGGQNMAQQGGNTISRHQFLKLILCNLKRHRCLSWISPNLPSLGFSLSATAPKTREQAIENYRLLLKKKRDLTRRKGVLQVLYCTVLYCTVLYCTVLYCTALYGAADQDRLLRPQAPAWPHRQRGPGRHHARTRRAALQRPAGQTQNNHLRQGI